MAADDVALDDVIGLVDDLHADVRRLARLSPATLAAVTGPSACRRTAAHPTGARTTDAGGTDSAGRGDDPQGGDRGKRGEDRDDLGADHHTPPATACPPPPPSVMADPLPAGTVGDPDLRHGTRRTGDRTDRGRRQQFGELPDDVDEDADDSGQRTDDGTGNGADPVTVDGPLGGTGPGSRPGTRPGACRGTAVPLLLFRAGSSTGWTCHWDLSCSS